MKTNYLVALLSALLLMAMCCVFLMARTAASPHLPDTGGALAPPVPTPTPFPDVPIPGVSDSLTCCLWQLEKSVSGNRQATFGNPYTCDMGPHRRGDLSLKMTLNSTGPTCDPNDIIPDGSVFEAKGSIIRRKDGFALFTGDFTVTSPAAKVLFKGRIETTDRLGSHHLTTKCEGCNPLSHFEGWFVGRGTDYPYTSYSIRGLIVARGTAPSVAQPTTTLTGSLSGTYIKCL